MTEPVNLPKPVRAPRVPKRIARKSRPRRERRTTLAALKRKLWVLFSRYVKDRDGNTCVSCGRGGLEGPGWHAGHLFPAGSHNIIRWEPKNVHSQCFHCNCNLGGNGAAYALWFIDKYGSEEFVRLSKRAQIIRPWRAHEVQDLIAALEKGGADYEMLYAERYGL